MDLNVLHRREQKSVGLWVIYRNMFYKKHYRGDIALITIYTSDRCTECERIKGKCIERGVEYTAIGMKDLEPSKVFQLRKDARDNKQLSMPLIYVNDSFMAKDLFEAEYLG